MSFTTKHLFFVLVSFISFSTDEADNKVIFLESSIICAEIFLEDLKILSLNLPGFETFLSLFVILNFFLVLVLNFIIFSYPLFSKHIDLFL